MEQYSKFLTIDNFKLAFDRLKTSQKTLYKNIYYPDLKIFEVFLEDNLKSLINQVTDRIYKPEKSHKIFIPKKNELVRPLSMLKFTDLIIYQALVNIIADEAHDKVAPKYGNIVFGNIINTSNSSQYDRVFFFQSWKKSWKNFSVKTKQYFTEGYRFLSEFDIASFFDTIDHNILIQILENEYKIEKEILDLLCECLQSWTADFNHKTFQANHGIPQGPISSPFLADLYLMYLDDEIIKAKLDIKYIRYVDDIRIFSKDRKVSRRAIAALDLISRDLGLIPQGNKILTKEITDIDKELRNQNESFSKINKEFQKETNGKSYKSLTAKTHRRLKERLTNCFIESVDCNRQEIYLDKTVISFALYKLNKDDDVKALLLNNYHLILTHFEGLLFYLRKHYCDDNATILFIKNILKDDDLLFHHLTALIFQAFPSIDFDEKIFERYVNNKNRNWLVRYFMVDWLAHHSKSELFELLISENDGNYFIQRKINSYKFILSNDTTFKKMFSTKLMKSSDSLIALQGLYLSVLYLNIFLRIETHKDYNHFIKQIIDGTSEDYIISTLKTDYGISDPEVFFNKNIWNDDTQYSELKESLLSYNRFRHNTPSIAILSLNNFNNLCYDKICERLNIIIDSKEYGVKLDSKKLEDKFPKMNRYWTEINSKRNQRSEAHSYNKDGQIRTKISRDELLHLHMKQIESLDEICNYRSF